MRNLFRFLSALGGIALCVTTAQAQTLTITDNLAPHSQLTRFEQFSTTLSARVEDAPKPNEETEIIGPTYEWSGGTSAVKLTSTTGASVGLQTDLPPKYGGSFPSYEGLVGDNGVSVTCTATFIAKNKKTKKESR